MPAPGQTTARYALLQWFRITTRPHELETVIDFAGLTKHFAIIHAVHDEFEERGGSYEGVLRFGEFCENPNENRCIFRLVVNVADSGQLEKLLEQLYLLCFELKAITDSDLIRQAMKDFTIKEARHILENGLLVYYPSPAETIASGFSEEEWRAIRAA